MSIALPGTGSLLSHIHHTLTKEIKGRTDLNKGNHQTLDDFCWILKDTSTRHTRIAELVPLLPSAEGNHCALGLGATHLVVPTNCLQHCDMILGLTYADVWHAVAGTCITHTLDFGSIWGNDNPLLGGIIYYPVAFPFEPQNG